MVSCFAFPSAHGVAQDRSDQSQTEPACTFGAATLRRGELGSSIDDKDCLGPSGSAAIFQAASLAKPVVAALALNLVLRGNLDLDQPISTLLPDGYLHRQNLFSLRAAPVVDAVAPRDTAETHFPKAAFAYIGPAKLGEQWPA